MGTGGEAEVTLSPLIVLPEPGDSPRKRDVSASLGGAGDAETRVADPPSRSPTFPAEEVGCDEAPVLSSSPEPAVRDLLVRTLDENERLRDSHSIHLAKIASLERQVHQLLSADAAPPPPTVFPGTGLASSVGSFFAEVKHSSAKAAHRLAKDPVERRASAPYHYHQADVKRRDAQLHDVTQSLQAVITRQQSRILELEANQETRGRLEEQSTLVSLLNGTSREVQCDAESVVQTAEKTTTANIEGDAERRLKDLERLLFTHEERAKDWQVQVTARTAEVESLQRQLRGKDGTLALDWH